jgi:hypothetical protein
MRLAQKRTIQTYDHRLRDSVNTTGDPALVIPYGVPRSTAHSWQASRRRAVVTDEVLDLDHLKLQAEVLKLRQQVRKLGVVICLLVTLLHAFGIRLEQHRLPEGKSKAGLLRAIERAQRVLSLVVRCGSYISPPLGTTAGNA